LSLAEDAPVPHNPRLMPMLESPCVPGLAAAALLLTGALLLLHGRPGQPGSTSRWLGLACLAVAASLAAARWTGVPASSGWQGAQLAGAGLLLAAALFRLGRLVHALHASEEQRRVLETRLNDVTAEIERSFAQRSELRVEQVTEQERKRIAADLHDDLGAKLLTIVHTCDNERIATLGREALDEMRLSVRGLNGRPMPLGDAMADWRAETVQRLSQTNIQVEWQSLDDEVSHLLPARTYVQTTRILREAVSNIIKHSGASRCEVRCFADARAYGLVVRDNGRGMASASQAALERGHGLSSMKHRARQLQGECHIESGVGSGTLIRLSLPW
jgi:signal transduction histidine kinase